MSMSTILQPQEGEKKPSALENAAKIMGIAVTVGNLGFKAADALKGVSAVAPTIPDLSVPVKNPQLDIKPLDIPKAPIQGSPEFSVFNPFNRGAE